MKKTLSCILILIISVGIFTPMANLIAQTSTNPSIPPTTGTANVNTPNPPASGDATVKKYDPKYILLEPLPCEFGSPGCNFNAVTEENEITEFDPTQDNNLGVYLNMMFRLFLGICAVLAVIMIVMGGIEYMTTELISNKEAGKERITHAIFGLLLAFGAWTLLNTINPNLLVSDLSSLENVTLKVIVDDSIPQSYDPATKKYKNGATFGQYWGGAVPALPQGVKTNYPGKDCATVGQDNCTSIKGLDFSFINTIQSKCPNKCGELTITGGTEFWLHGGSSGNTSHGQGSPTIDLRPTDPLNLYIKSGKQIDPKDPTRWTKDGISYFFEGDHWHVYK